MTSFWAAHADRRPCAALVAELGPKARAATVADAANAAISSWSRFRSRAIGRPLKPLAGKIVIDTNNYYPQRDGQIPELDNDSTTTSELLRRSCRSRRS